MDRINALTSLELCAGAGGQALGLEWAGFHHVGLAEIDADCCKTLKLNRPQWNVSQRNILDVYDWSRYRGIDLLAGGLPCPPFSVAGKQLGDGDERNLFPPTFEIIRATMPRAVLIENVRGLMSAKFEWYREHIEKVFSSLDYHVAWKVINASDFGVPQLRPRVVIVAVRKAISEYMDLENLQRRQPPTVGECLTDLMQENGWRGAAQWTRNASKIAPTVVGGSKKHGGPDLGPTRAKRAWTELDVNGHGVANDAPGPDFVGSPKLTVRMVARLQGFPDGWQIWGRKTTAYRQVGNAFPPPVAATVGSKISECLMRREIFYGFVNAAE